MGREEVVKRAVGKADAFELLSCAFAYPDERLAQGLVDGSFADDARACLLDAGADPAAADSTAEALAAWRDASAADLLAERWSVNFSDHKGLAMLGKGVMNLSGRNVKFFLAKPLTYMNESGNALASISAYYQIEPDHIVVIHDDMDLDFGRIKVKAGGSAGGHNGIKSIDRALGTPKYARVRMGVGHAQRGAHAHDNTVNWVLGGFGPDQRKQLPEFLADGADAAETIIFNGLAKAQEQFNGR